MECPKCRTENPSDSRFCKECATPLPSGRIGFSKTETYQRPVKELTTGSTFAGRYQVIEDLGHGGMGRVYKVFDTKIKEKVALKLINPEIASDRDTIDRFSNEIRLARKVRHKNVCQMFDLGEIEGTHFITMEYVTGEDLKSMVRMSKTLSIGAAVHIAMQICQGLAEAHRLGIIHRDLKPSNIMIDREGDVRIMDFGVARTLREQGITGDGVIIGTPEYMSPEQREGREIDQQSDLFSLGIILYEMVTGRRPFEGDAEVPRNPREFNPQAPEDLNRLILKCLATDKRKRHQSADELYSELSKIEGSIKEETGKTKRARSIAVLPFTDLSSQKDQEFFCDGIAEEIISSLTKIKNLRVVARTSAFSFKGKDLDIHEIGQRLNVETVLEGSVRKAGKKLRITVDLINVADGYYLWSERYDCEMDDIFAIQDSVTRAIIEKLKIEFLEEDKADLWRPQTKDLDAYSLYLKGRYFWSQRAEAGLMKAVDCFEQAIALDPGYALAHAGLADSYIILCWYGYLPAGQGLPKAKASALKALGVSPGLAEAHASLAFCLLLYDWDWPAAEKEFRQAIELNRGYAFAHQGYFQYLIALGRTDEALSEMKKAIELDPLSLGINSGLAWGFYFSRQYDKAIEQSLRTLELDANIVWAQYVLGVSYLMSSRPAEAVEELQRLGSFSALHPLTAAVLGAAYARGGDEAKMKEVLGRFIDGAKHGYVMPFYVAIIYLGSGDKDKIFEWLEKACDERDYMLIFLKSDPLFDGLRSEPRFRAMLSRIGLEE